MPALLGIVPINILVLKSEVLAHIAAGVAIFFMPLKATATSTEMYWVYFFAISCFYMPTIALNNSVSYAVLK
jgi:NHS family xanthosine MFS transporter